MNDNKDLIFDARALSLACNYFRERKDEYIEDCLIIGVDFSPNDTDMMMVMRRKGNETHIINSLKDEEAVKLYNKLIGKPYGICYKCIHRECAWKGDNVERCEYFEKVR